MNTLTLIRHAMPHVDPSKQARDWVLSPEGQQSCQPLAEAIKPYAPQHMITSDEPKAHETGQRIANHLHIPCTTAPNLHEHDRTNVPFQPNKTTWHTTIKTFFAQPNTLILGNETAAQACKRFTTAVDHALATHPDPLAIATHGTVISLFVAHKTNTNGYHFWQHLELPAFVVFDRTTFEMVEIQNKIQ